MRHVSIRDLIFWIVTRASTRDFTVTKVDTIQFLYRMSVHRSMTCKFYMKNGNNWKIKKKKLKKFFSLAGKRTRVAGVEVGALSTLKVSFFFDKHRWRWGRNKIFLKCNLACFLCIKQFARPQISINLCIFLVKFMWNK